MSVRFEMGPIRPPSEAYSILLRVTRNCPWNRCVFCPVYKGRKFSPRTVEEVKSDIDAIAFIAEKLDRAKSDPGSVDRVLAEEKIEIPYIQQVAFWLHCGAKSVFLQDADSLVIKTEKLVEILRHIRETFPSIERITSYSRAKTVSKKSAAELKELRGAGLDRLHLGLESGSARVLEVLNKGVTPQEQVAAGQKAVAAGFELSEYFMPGCGGKELSRENALESAKVLNQIDPTFIRLRSTRVIFGTPLHQLMIDGKWTPLGEEAVVKEIKLFIENLDSISSTILSDHIMNLIEDAAGKLPSDKDSILATLDRFLAMKLGDRESFIVGRRLGYFRHLSDYRPDTRIERLKNQIKAQYGSLDEAVRHIAQTY